MEDNKKRRHNYNAKDELGRTCMPLDQKDEKCSTFVDKLASLHVCSPLPNILALYLRRGPNSKKITSGYKPFHKQPSLWKRSWLMHLAIVSNIGANTAFNSTTGKKDGKHPQQQKQQQNGENCK